MFFERTTRPSERIIKIKHRHELNIHVMRCEDNLATLLESEIL